MSFLAQGVGLVTPAGICYDYNLGLCFFTDIEKDFLYMANINGTWVKPYVNLKIGESPKKRHYVTRDVIKSVFI